MYLEQMLFLIPLTQQHTTPSNYSPLTGNNGTDERKRTHKVQVAAHPKLHVESNSTKVIHHER